MTELKSDALALREANQISEFHAFASIEMFENAQRMAMCLCKSTIVPEGYRGDNAVGNCVIALEISNRIGANVLAVMQNLYIVHGKPAWSSQFLISCVNASRRFSPLRYKMTGEKDKDTWGCIAWATDKTGEVLESPEVTIKMAKDEGWYGKNGSKWKTIPELMLRYRAATFFTRLYAPEITMGIVTREEVQDAVEIEAEVVAPTSLPSFAPRSDGAPAPKDVVLGQPTPTAKRRGCQPKAPESPAPSPEPQPATEVAPPEQPIEPPQPPEPPQASEERTFEQIVDGTPAKDSPEVAALRTAMTAYGVVEAQVLKFCAEKKVNGKDGTPPKTLADLKHDSIANLTKHFTASQSNIAPQIKATTV